MSIVIAIDGPASAGKTTVGSELARKLGYQFVDSGSIYRAGCYYMLQNDLPIDSDEQAASIFNSLDIQLMSSEQGHHVFVHGEDVTRHLGSPEVTAVVPVIGGRYLVREVVKNIQRDLGTRQNTVMTGRDIGTEIFPDAQIKYFLSASPEVRATRRLRQLSQEGRTASFDELLQKIVLRDHFDSTREVSPFRMPDNAIVVDTSNLSIEAVVNKMYYFAIFMRTKEGQIRSSDMERF